MPHMRPIIALFIATSLFAISCHAQVPFTEGVLALRHLQLPKDGRIIEISIFLPFGWVSGISNIPQGWSVQVDNDNQDSARLLLRARTEGAAISEVRLNKLIIGASITNIQESAKAISGTYTLLTNAEHGTKIVPLIAYSIEFLPRYARQRLY